MSREFARGKQELLKKRYSSLSLHPEDIRFIDRMVADSRQVALNHTAGLSLPQQTQMSLFASFALLDAENTYKKRMQDMIHEYGGRNYTIFFDRETLALYGYIEVEDPAKWDESADTAINRKWWDFMADIMETNPDNSPVSIDLHEVFHLD